MKIGLLLCDHVPQELLPLDGDYPDMFKALFPEINFTVYPVCENVFPDDVEACDAYIVNGSRHSVYDDIPWILKLKEFVRTIRDAEKFYLGVCFGHQMLAEALGGKVRKSKSGWCVGAHEFEILTTESWMQPAREKLNVLMMCQDQVYQLPENSRILARNPECQIAMLMVGNKMLGIQAHPEFSKAYNQVLMEKRREPMGQAKVEKGLMSLGMEVDNEIFRDWVMAFLKYPVS